MLIFFVKLYPAVIPASEPESLSPIWIYTCNLYLWIPVLQRVTLYRTVPGMTKNRLKFTLDLIGEHGKQAIAQRGVEKKTIDAIKQPAVTRNQFSGIFHPTGSLNH